METETFVGLDIAKNSVVATAVDPLGQRIDPSTLGPTDAEWIAYLRRLPGTKRVALEACTMGEHFHDAAVAAGTDVVLSHPYKTRRIADASLKSDTVDSEALATLLRLRALPTSFVPDATARALRRVVRDRVFYRKQQKAVANHTYALLLAKGIPYEEGILGLKRRREELRALHLPEVERGRDRLHDLDLATRELDTAIHAAFVESPEAQPLESIPGVGELTAHARGVPVPDRPLREFRRAQLVLRALPHEPPVGGDLLPGGAEVGLQPHPAMDPGRGGVDPPTACSGQLCRPSGPSRCAAQGDEAGCHRRRPRPPPRGVRGPQERDAVYPSRSREAELQVWDCDVLVTVARL